jgi:DNA-binding NarL/FixJ family response regulator
VAVPEKRQSPGALIATVLRRRPRVVFVDLDLGQFGDGEQLIAPLARAGVNVIVVTASVDRARWGEAVRCGARKVLPKSRPLNEILATVRRINQGLQVMTLEEREDLLREWAKERAANVDLNARLETLTVREREVLAYLMKGQTVREIATECVVAEATVRTHRWLYANKEAAIDFLAKEMPLKPDLARRGWEYYIANRIWHPNAEIDLEGLKITMQIYAEQTKDAAPQPFKYIDQSYLQQAIKELG